MHLTLSPIRGLPGQPETALAVTGEVLIYDGIAWDLASVPEGGDGIAWDLASVPEAGDAAPIGDHPFIGPITRLGGVIHATIRVSLGDTAAPDQPDSPWITTVTDGPVTIPAARIGETAERRSRGKPGRPGSGGRRTGKGTRRGI